MKSQASVLAACARKKARHDERVRCGAGLRPASSSTLRTEVAATRTPRPLSSPTIRLYPQCGFSLASRRISVWSERSSGGRPGGRCEYVHRRAMSWRCQRSSVSGLNRKTVQAGRGSERLSAVNSARSAGASFGPGGGGSPARGGGRGSPPPSSDAAAPAATPARTDSGQRDTRTTRASSPPSTTTKNTEPSEPDARESRGRVCEPYALLFVLALVVPFLRNFYELSTPTVEAVGAWAAGVALGVGGMLGALRLLRA